MKRRGSARKEVSAGGIVFRRDGDRTLVLLIRDSYRNWGFPKGHVESGEEPGTAALREVGEETGLDALVLRAPIETIDWEFRFRGRRVHKTCHFYLIETESRRTAPQRAEGITACRWASFAQAERMIAYDNARAVLRQARELLEASGPTQAPSAGSAQPRSARAS